jgi:hypothetical protein
MKRYYTERVCFWSLIGGLLAFWSAPDNPGALSSDEVGALIFAGVFTLGGAVVDLYAGRWKGPGDREAGE